MRIDVATLRDLLDVAEQLTPADRRELAVTRDPNDAEALAIDAWRSNL